MYKTSDIALKTNIHPNTVRFYERLGLISDVPRDQNGYRIFNDRHLNQIMILRCIYLYNWPGDAIRKASMAIIKAMKDWKLEKARSLTQTYKKTIEAETEKARQAIDILRQWSEQRDWRSELGVAEEPGEGHSRREAAAIIGTTPEALRNWERNDLIRIPRQGQHQARVYRPLEMERLKVIYLLRQSRFSMSAIHSCLVKLDAGQRDEALKSLKNLNEEDVVWTGDQWLEVLQRTAEKAREIEEILDRVEEKSQTLQ